MQRTTRALVLFAALLRAATVRAESAPSPPSPTPQTEPVVDEPPAPPPPTAVGFQLDALPTVLSAAHGKLGYAPQLWYGVGGLRVRVVVAHLEPPDAFAHAPAGFRDARITAYGAIAEYTFGRRFDGPWIGAGYEVWFRSIAHDEVAGRATWTQLALTFGCGYIHRFHGNFYVDPWIGAHVLDGTSTATLGQHVYKPMPMVIEGSLKVGWFLTL